MCTVSFYKNAGYAVLTSNRDEGAERALAHAPKEEEVNGVRLFFPKDPQGGGTWFVARDNGNVFILLNGAEIKHKHQPPYRISRGVVLLELAAGSNVHEAWTALYLEGVEPFTVVAFADDLLYQLRWNGTVKESRMLSTEVPHIWSSSTLYSPEVALQRKQWFADFLEQHRAPLTPDELLHFHATTKGDDSTNGLVMNRGVVLTKSITQVVLHTNGFRIEHRDLVQQKQHNLSYDYS